MQTFATIIIIALIIIALILAYRRKPLAKKTKTVNITGNWICITDSDGNVEYYAAKMENGLIKATHQNGNIRYFEHNPKRCGEWKEVK